MALTCFACAARHQQPAAAKHTSCARSSPFHSRHLSPFCTALPFRPSVMSESAKINEVPEIVLAKRRQRQVQRANNIRAKLKQRGLKQKRADTLIFRRAEKFVKERRKKDKDMKRLKRQAKQLLSFMGETADQATSLLFVIRLAASIPMSDPTKKALKALGVPTKFSGAFIRETAETKRLLMMAGPFITWGKPNLRSIRELVFKRGLSRPHKDGKAAPLMDNTTIEAALGDLGIICMDDLVHEIFTVGTNFDKVSQFIGKFNLSDPHNLPSNKMVHHTIGGRYGDRAEGINEIIQSMV